MGTSQSGSVQQATFFSIGANPINLGSFGGSSSRADGINALGQIVGMSTLPGDLAMHATIFELGASPVDLNNLIDPLSGWTLQEATAINAKGDIVGYGKFNGQSLAFLASPVSAVPVPAAVWLFGTGLLGLTCFARKREAT